MVKSWKRLKHTFEMQDMEESSDILLLNGSKSSAKSKEKKLYNKGANLLQSSHASTIGHKLIIKQWSRKYKTMLLSKLFRALKLTTITNKSEDASLAWCGILSASVNQVRLGLTTKIPSSKKFSRELESSPSRKNIMEALSRRSNNLRISSSP